MDDRLLQPQPVEERAAAEELSRSCFWKAGLLLLSQEIWLQNLSAAIVLYPAVGMIVRL